MRFVRFRAQSESNPCLVTISPQPASVIKRPKIGPYPTNCSLLSDKRFYNRARVSGGDSSRRNEATDGSVSFTLRWVDKSKHQGRRRMGRGGSLWPTSDWSSNWISALSSSVLPKLEPKPNFASPGGMCQLGDESVDF